MDIRQEKIGNRRSTPDIVSGINLLFPIPVPIGISIISGAYLGVIQHDQRPVKLVSHAVFLHKLNVVLMGIIIPYDEQGVVCIGDQAKGISDRAYGGGIQHHIIKPGL